MLEQKFTDAVTQVSLLDQQPTHVQLNLYGLFKQARKGNVSGSRPGLFDVRGRAKYDAWASRQGMSADEAMTAYIEAAIDLGV